MSLKKRELKFLVSKINEELERVTESVAKVSESKPLATSDRGKDEVDQATSEYERSQQLRFQRRDRLYERKLIKTLKKVEEDEYGICEDCGCDIKFERLKARPTAELCITCKDEAEKEEQGNFLRRQSKSMGQTVSLVGANA